METTYNYCFEAIGISKMHDNKEEIEIKGESNYLDTLMLQIEVKKEFWDLKNINIFKIESRKMLIQENI